MALSLGDLSRALDLNARYDAPRLDDHDEPRPKAATTSSNTSAFGLGDLSSIWSFLGTPPPPTVAELSPPASPLATKSAVNQAKQPRRAAAVKSVSSSALPVQPSTPSKKAKSHPKPPTEAVIPNTHAPRSVEVKKDVVLLPNNTKKPVRPKSPVSVPAAKTAPVPITPAKATVVEQKTIITWEESQAAAQQQTPVVQIDRVDVSKVSTPAKRSVGLFPSSVPPLASGGKPITPEARPRFTASRSFHPSSTPRSIQPRTARSLEDKDWDLYLRIIQNFPLDRRTLVAPMNLTTHNHDPAGIHVFVDASNIFIGFLKAMKLARGIADHVRIPRADLSFDGLALLMERRRPVAKRVLVGSTPHLPAFDTAANVGYQCSILEKVEKQRKLTERQIFFKEQEESRRQGLPFPSSHHRSRTTRPVGGGGNTSDSNLSSSPPQYAKLAKVEQGVDEILHLKICESVLDNPGRPGTIVLATGDAAEAEYSDGFLRTIERALEHGWKVELMSWRKSISALYKRREWRGRWEDRFRIVELDDYAEDLLDLTSCGLGDDRGAESA